MATQVFSSFRQDPDLLESLQARGLGRGVVEAPGPASLRLAGPGRFFANAPADRAPKHPFKVPPDAMPTSGWLTGKVKRSLRGKACARGWRA